MLPRISRISVLSAITNALTLEIKTSLIHLLTTRLSTIVAFIVRPKHFIKLRLRTLRYLTDDLKPPMDDLSKKLRVAIIKKSRILKIMSSHTPLRNTCFLQRQKENSFPLNFGISLM